MTDRIKTNINGVNVEQLHETVQAIEKKPDMANFKFRSETEWISGGHSRTKIKDFYGAGTKDTSRDKPLILEGDEPPVLLGDNKAPNAVETMLHALASCLAVGFIYNASAQGIEVDSLQFNMEGELDLHNFLGISDEVRPGYKHIQVEYEVESDAPREKLEELCEYVQKTSPVLDMIRNPVPVSVHMTA